MISIGMIKTWSSSIYKPPNLVFRSCPINCTFPSEWKEVNIFFHKEGDKQVLKNYLTISLLPILWKIVWTITI